MIATIHHPTGDFKIDFSKPLDISIHTSDKETCSKAWYVDSIKITPVLTDQFIGSVIDGGTVNFRNIFFNPHGNTTHTECVGHISEEVYNLQDTLKSYFFKAQLISLKPKNYSGIESEWKKNDDEIITLDQINGIVEEDIDALIIRTLPNSIEKTKMQWSSTNWPYMDESVAEYLAEAGIKHLLIDLPSIDREFDGGKMLSHRAFWQFPKATRFDATISEMIYVDNEIKDGIYFLSLQPSSFINDAAPCKPVLYQTL